MRGFEDIGFDGFDRFIEDEAHADRGGEVVNLIEGLVFEIRERVADGFGDEGQSVRSAGFSEEFDIFGASGRKVIDDGDSSIGIFFEKVLGEVRTDEAGASGYEYARQEISLSR